MNISFLIVDKYFHVELESDGLGRFALEPEMFSNLGK